MDEEFKKTSTWNLYQKSVEYLQKQNLYGDTDTFIRFYLGDQWHGLKVSKSVEPICLNIIKQIVNQKTSIVTENLFAINYSPENGDNQEFIQNATSVCKSLNRYASRIWDLDQMDYKVKMWAKKNAVVGQAICYTYYDSESKRPINEMLNNVDIMFGDESSDDIQSQPYILVRQRKTVSEVRKLAKEKGLKEEEINAIVGDNDTSTIAGNQDEIEDKVWLITKFVRKEDNKIYYSTSAKFIDIETDVPMGIELYPFSIWNWDDREGSARGVGEVEYLKSNQIEINKIMMRRSIASKNISYPQKVVNEDAISNIKDINKVGATVLFKDMGGARASDVFMVTQTGQMGPDAEKIQAELISLSKDLTNVSEATTGNLDPSSASGRAILAVQQAQNQPLTDQVVGLKKFLEDIARIWFEYWKKNAKDITVFYTEVEPTTGEQHVVEATVDKNVLKRLQAFVKVDVTPRGPYDRYAQELSLENLMQAGFITFEEYVEALDADSVMPKVKLEAILKQRKETQARINQMDLEAQQLMNAQAQDMVNANNVAQIQDEGSSLMAQALQEAQTTAHGSDTNKNDVSNNVQLAG